MSFHNHLGVRNPVGENRSRNKCFLRVLNALQHWNLKFQGVSFHVNEVSEVALFE